MRCRAVRPSDAASLAPRRVPPAGDASRAAVYDPGAMGTLPPPVPASPHGHVPPASGPDSGRAVATMVLGIIGLVSGFTGITLLCAVAANALGSLAIQEIDASGGRRGGRGKAVAGMACATAGLVLWVSLFAVLAATGAIE